MYIDISMKPDPNLSARLRAKVERKHITNLISMIACFEPEMALVNESGGPGGSPFPEGEPKWTGRYKQRDGANPAPDIHALVNGCFGAVGEMKQFIDGFERVRAAHKELSADARSAYIIAQRNGVEANALEFLIDTLVSQRNQTLDVLEKLADAFALNDHEQIAAVQEAARQHIRFIRGGGTKDENPSLKSVPAPDKGTQPEGNG